MTSDEERKRRDRESQRRLVARRKAAGYCRSCDSPATNGVFCERHAARRDGYRLKTRKTEGSPVRRVAVKAITASANELAYAAGVIDGEGCIHFGGADKTKSLTVGIRVSMTTLSVVEFLHRTLGGSLKPKKMNDPKAQPQWIWYAYGDGAVASLKAIEPYLVGKREQCLLGIKCHETLRQAPRTGYRGRQHTVETLVYIVAVEEKMKELKKGGGR